MAPVMSQDVNLDFFAGTQGTAMSTDVFDKLPSELQDAVLESAYLTQIWVQGHHEAGLVQIVGNTNPQFPDIIYAKNGVRYTSLSDKAKREAEEMCSPEFQPQAWEQWRERLNNWAGGMDTYKEIYNVAREIPKDRKVVNVEARRWWRA